jgi:hypothetical protein
VPFLPSPTTVAAVAAGPSPGADLSAIATALSAIALAVLVAAGRAVPGWGPDLHGRVLRGIVLVPTIAFFSMAAVAANVLAGGIAVHTRAGAGDVRFFQDLLAFGTAALGVLFLAALFVPIRLPNVGRSRRLTAC